jgi:hypothetical protein
MPIQHAVTVLQAVVTLAQAPSTCDAPLDIMLGESDVICAPTTVSRSVVPPCMAEQTVHNATYLRFTAPTDGWYSLHLVSTDVPDWRPRIAVLESCAAQDSIAVGWTQFGRPFCADGIDTPGAFTSATFYATEGSVRLIVAGGETPSESGSGVLRASLIGPTLMHGARELILGDNPFTVADLEPTLPYQGACASYTEDRMHNASRFTFVPDQSGLHTFSFCTSSRYDVVLATSPNLEVGSLITSSYGCLSGGGISARLTAGVTYYLAAGFFDHYDACDSLNALVEFGEGCVADLDRDGSVIGSDLAILLSSWGEAANDLNADGIVDGADLALLLGSWGNCGA